MQVAPPLVHRPTIQSAGERIYFPREKLYLKIGCPNIFVVSLGGTTPMFSPQHPAYVHKGWNTNMVVHIYLAIHVLYTMYTYNYAQSILMYKGYSVFQERLVCLRASQQEYSQSTKCQLYTRKENDKNFH